MTRLQRRYNPVDANSSVSIKLKNDVNDTSEDGKTITIKHDSANDVSTYFVEYELPDGSTNTVQLDASEPVIYVNIGGEILDLSLLSLYFGGSTQPTTMPDVITNATTATIAYTGDNPNGRALVLSSTTAQNVSVDVSLSSSPAGGGAGPYVFNITLTNPNNFVGIDGTAIFEVKVPNGSGGYVTVQGDPLLTDPIPIHVGATLAEDDQSAEISNIEYSYSDAGPWKTFTNNVGIVSHNGTYFAPVYVRVTAASNTEFPTVTRSNTAEYVEHSTSYAIDAQSSKVQTLQIYKITPSGEALFKSTFTGSTDFNGDANADEQTIDVRFEVAMTASLPAELSPPNNNIITTAEFTTVTVEVTNLNVWADGVDLNEWNPVIVNPSVSTALTSTQTEAPANGNPAKFTATYTLTPLVADTNGQNFTFRHGYHNGVGVENGQPLEASVNLIVFEETTASDIDMILTPNKTSITLTETITIDVLVKNTNSSVWVSTVNTAEWDPENEIGNPATTTLDTSTVRLIEQQNGEPAKFESSYTFTPTITGQQLVTFTFGSIARSVSINVTNSNPIIISATVNDSFPRVGKEITFNVYVRNDGETIWENGVVDTSEWNPTVIAPTNVTAGTITTVPQQNGDPALYIAQFTYTPSAIGPESFVFSHDDNGTMQSTTVHINARSTVGSDYYVNMLLSANGSYTRLLPTTQDELPYHYYLLVDKDINNTIFSTFRIAITSTGGGEGDPRKEFVEHSGNLHLDSIKDAFKDGVTGGGVNSSVAFEHVVHQMILGATAADADGVFRSNTQRTVPILNTGTDSGTTTYTNAVDTLILNADDEKLDNLADQMYKDGKSSASGGSVNLTNGDKLHLTLKIDLTATGNVRDGQNDGVQSGNSLMYASNPENKHTPVEDQILIRVVVTHQS